MVVQLNSAMPPKYSISKLDGVDCPFINWPLINNDYEQTLNRKSPSPCLPMIITVQVRYMFRIFLLD